MNRCEGGVPRVRDFEPEDRDRCLAIFDTNVPRFFRESERAEFQAYLDELPGPYLVLEDEHGVIVGCGGYVVVQDEERVDLCWGMVRRHSQGRGLGRLLTRARLARAVGDRSVREVRLSTSQRTTGFYERLGFRTVSVETDGFAPGLDRCDLAAPAEELRRRLRSDGA